MLGKKGPEGCPVAAYTYVCQLARGCDNPATDPPLPTGEQVTSRGSELTVEILLLSRTSQQRNYGLVEPAISCDRCIDPV